MVYILTILEQSLNAPVTPINKPIILEAHSLFQAVLEATIYPKGRDDEQAHYQESELKNITRLGRALYERSLLAQGGKVKTTTDAASDTQPAIGLLTRATARLDMLLMIMKSLDISIVKKNMMQ